jgi:arginyl-tRNA--protein-N-Asp/Glu arginylyltransferase
MFYRNTTVKKMGQLFIDQVLEIAQQTQVEYIWLGVWERNYRALDFILKMDLSHLTNIFSH